MIINEECINNKYPVIIDPQGQAFRYMKDNMTDVQKLDIMSNAVDKRVFMKASSKNAVRTLERALEMGQVVFCENSGEVTNPHILQILRKEITAIG